MVYSLPLVTANVRSVMVPNDELVVVASALMYSGIMWFAWFATAWPHEVMMGSPAEGTVTWVTSVSDQVFDGQVAREGHRPAMTGLDRVLHREHLPVLLIERDGVERV